MRVGIEGHRRRVAELLCQLDVRCSRMSSDANEWRRSYGRGRPSPTRTVAGQKIRLRQLCQSSLRPGCPSARGNTKSSGLGEGFHASKSPASASRKSTVRRTRPVFWELELAVAYRLLDQERALTDVTPLKRERLPGPEPGVSETLTGWPSDGRCARVGPRPLARRPRAGADERPPVDLVAACARPRPGWRSPHPTRRRC